MVAGPVVAEQEVPAGAVVVELLPVVDEPLLAVDVLAAPDEVAVLLPAAVVALVVPDAVVRLPLGVPAVWELAGVGPALVEVDKSGDAATEAPAAAAESSS